MKKLFILLVWIVCLCGVLAAGAWYTSRGSSEIVISSEGIAQRVTRGIVPEGETAQEVAIIPEQEIITAADAVKTSIVTIHTVVGTNPRLRELEDKFIARGIVISPKGQIVTSAAAFGDVKAMPDATTYTVQLAGIQDPVAVESVQRYGDLAVITISADVKPKHQAQLTTTPVESSVASELVMALGGDTVTHFSPGLTVSSADVAAIATDIDVALAYGTPLVGRDGTVAGMLIEKNDSGQKAVFMGSQAISSALKGE